METGFLSLSPKPFWSYVAHLIFSVSEQPRDLLTGSVHLHSRLQLRRRHLTNTTALFLHCRNKKKIRFSNEQKCSNSGLLWKFCTTLFSFLYLSPQYFLLTGYEWSYFNPCTIWLKNRYCLTCCSWSRGRWGRWGTGVLSWLPNFPTGWRGPVHCPRNHPLAPCY